MQRYVLLLLRRQRPLDTIGVEEDILVNEFMPWNKEWHVVEAALEEDQVFADFRILTS